MPQIHRKGDLCTGHENWIPRANIEGSPNVFCNKLPVHRKGDGWAVHTCPPSFPPQPHDGRANSGSTSVFINGKPVCRIGDSVDCGSRMMTGSSDVYAGE